MLDGVMLLWFILTALSVVFVAWDIRATPESPVLKWGFVLVTVYTGPVGAFLYAVGCREPLPGTHERYVAATWRQVLGSTMHCVAGDGVGILAGAVIGSLFLLSPGADFTLEYVLGFGFGWTIFQALFMKNEMGGSYTGALRNTFLAELLSMNGLMAGMVAVTSIARADLVVEGPLSPAFWFVMSMGLLSGFVVAYPINWWLVTNHLKHGMMTVRSSREKPEAEATGAHERHGMAPMAQETASGHQAHASSTAAEPSAGLVASMTVFTFVLLAAGLVIASVFGSQ